MQLKQMLIKRSTQNLRKEDIAPSEDDEKPKESFLEHENPKYLLDISHMKNIENQSWLFKFDHCDFSNVESSVRCQMSVTHKPFQCECCNLKKMSSNIMKTYHDKKQISVGAGGIGYGILWEQYSRDPIFSHVCEDTDLK